MAPSLSPRNFDFTATVPDCQTTAINIIFHYNGGPLTTLVFLSDDSDASVARFHMPLVCGWLIRYDGLDVQWVMRAGVSKSPVLLVGDAPGGKNYYMEMVGGGTATVVTNGNSLAANSVFQFSTSTSSTADAFNFAINIIEFTGSASAGLPIFGTNQVATTLTFTGGTAVAGTVASDQSLVLLHSAAVTLEFANGAALTITHKMSGASVTMSAAATLTVNALTATNLTLTVGGSTGALEMAAAAGTSLYFSSFSTIGVRNTGTVQLNVTGLPSSIATVYVTGSGSISVPADNNITTLSAIGGSQGVLTGALTIAGTGTITSYVGTCSSIASGCLAGLTTGAGVLITTMTNAHATGPISLQGTITTCTSAVGFLRSAASIGLGPSLVFCGGQTVSIGATAGTDAALAITLTSLNAPAALTVNAPVSLLTISGSTGIVLNAGARGITALTSSGSNYTRLDVAGAATNMALSGGDIVLAGTWGNSSLAVGNVTWTGGGGAPGTLTAFVANFSASGAAFGALTLDAGATATGSWQLFGGATVGAGLFGATRGFGSGLLGSGANATLLIATTNQLSLSGGAYASTLIAGPATASGSALSVNSATVANLTAGSGAVPFATVLLGAGAEVTLSAVHVSGLFNASGGAVVRSVGGIVDAAGATTALVGADLSTGPTLVIPTSPASLAIAGGTGTLRINATQGATLPILTVTGAALSALDLSAAPVSGVALITIHGGGALWLNGTTAAAATLTGGSFSSLSVAGFLNATASGVTLGTVGAAVIASPGGLVALDAMTLGTCVALPAGAAHFSGATLQVTGAAGTWCAADGGPTFGPTTALTVGSGVSLESVRVATSVAPAISIAAATLGGAFGTPTALSGLANMTLSGTTLLANFSATSVGSMMALTSVSAPTVTVVGTVTPVYWISDGSFGALQLGNSSDSTVNATFQGAASVAALLVRAAAGATLSVGGLLRANATLDAPQLTLYGSQSVHNFATLIFGGSVATVAWSGMYSGGAFAIGGTVAQSYVFSDFIVSGGLTLNVTSPVATLADSVAASIAVGGADIMTLRNVTSDVAGHVLTWTGRTLRVTGCNGLGLAATATGNTIFVNDSTVYGALTSATDCTLTNVVAAAPGLNATCANIRTTGLNGTAFYGDCQSASGLFALGGTVQLTTLGVGLLRPCGAVVLDATGVVLADVSSILGMNATSIAIHGAAWNIHDTAGPMAATGLFLADGGARFGTAPSTTNPLLVTACNATWNAAAINKALVVSAAAAMGCTAKVGAGTAVNGSLTLGAPPAYFAQADTYGSIVTPAGQDVSVAVLQNSASTVEMNGQLRDLAGQLQSASPLCATRAACNALLYVRHTDVLDVSGVDPLITLILDNSSLPIVNGTIYVTDATPIMIDVHCTTMIIVASVPVYLQDISVVDTLIFDGTGPVIIESSTVGNVSCLVAPSNLTLINMVIVGTDATLCSAGPLLVQNASALAAHTTLAAATVATIIATGRAYGDATLTADCEAAPGVVSAVLTGGTYEAIASAATPCGALVLRNVTTTGSVALVSTGTADLLGVTAGVAVDFSGAALAGGTLVDVVAGALALTTGGPTNVTDFVGGNLTAICAGAGGVVTVRGTATITVAEVGMGSCSRIDVGQPVSGNVTISSTASDAHLVFSSTQAAASIQLLASLTGTTQARLVGPFVAGGPIVMTAASVVVTDLTIGGAFLNESLWRASQNWTGTNIVVNPLTGSSVFRIETGRTFAMRSGVFDIIQATTSDGQFDSVRLSDMFLRGVRSVGSAPSALWSLTNVTTGASNNETLELALADGGAVEIVGASIATASWPSIVLFAGPGVTCTAAAFVRITVNAISYANCGLNFTQVAFSNPILSFSYVGTFLVLDTLVTIPGPIVATTSGSIYINAVETLGGLLLTGGTMLTLSDVNVPNVTASGFSGAANITNLVSSDGIALATGGGSVMINPVIAGRLTWTATNTLGNGGLLIDGQGGNTIASLVVDCAGGAFSLLDETVTELVSIADCSNITISGSTLSAASTTAGYMQAAGPVALSNSSVCAASTCTLTVNAPRLALTNATMGPMASGMGYERIDVTRSAVAAFSGATALLVMSYQTTPFGVSGLPGCAVIYDRVQLPTGGLAESCPFVTMFSSTVQNYSHAGATSIALTATTIGRQGPVRADALTMSGCTVLDISVGPTVFVYAQYSTATGTLSATDCVFHAASDTTDNVMFSSKFLGSTTLVHDTFYVGASSAASPPAPVFAEGVAALTFEQCRFPRYSTGAAGGVLFAADARLGQCNTPATPACLTAHYWGAASGPSSLGDITNLCTGNGVHIFGAGLTLDYYYPSSTFGTTPQRASCETPAAATTPTTTSEPAPWIGRTITASFVILLLAALALAALVIYMGVEYGRHHAAPTVPPPKVPGRCHRHGRMR